MKRASRFVTFGSLVALCWCLYLVVALDPANTQPSQLLAQGRQALIGLSVPSRKADLASEQDGTIRELPVEEGSRVTEDQVLFKLSSTLLELRANRLKAIIESDLAVAKGRSTVEHARRKSGRLKKLEADEVVSEANLEDSEFDVQLALLQLRQAEFEKSQARNELLQIREQLRQRAPRSPFPGVVTEIYKQLGEAAERLTAVLQVVALDPLWIEFECPVGKQTEFKEDVELMVAPATRPSDQRRAKIIHVSLKANPSSHTFLVRAAVANPDYSWRMGLKMLVHPPQQRSAIIDPATPPPRAK